MSKPYLTYASSKPGRASLLLKRVSDKKSEVMKNKTVLEYREAQHMLADVRVMPRSVAAEDVVCAGVPCQWVYHIKKARHEKVILYIHGGGWAFGNLATAKAVGVLLAESSGYRVLMAQYRLSPEHKYPAAPEDCMEVYKWLLAKGYKPENIAFMGDSAGGNLSLCMLNRIKAAGMPFPACVCCASPVTDMREESAIVSTKTDLIYTVYKGRQRDIFSLYLGRGVSRDDPFVSPVTGDLSGLPPILIHAGGDEPIAIDNEAYADKAYGQGVDIHLKIWPEMFHDFSIVGNTLKESRQSLAEIVAFCADHLG